MNTQRLFFWLLILFLLLTMKPGRVWKEGKQLWQRREYILRVLVTLVLGYLLYGLYSLYNYIYLK